MGFRTHDSEAAQKPRENPVDRYIRQLLEQKSGLETPLFEETDFPALDILEMPDCIIVEAELPGVRPENLEVSLTAGLLFIEGDKEEILDSGKINFLCMERSFGRFRRVVPILQSLDLSGLRAIYRSGVLRVVIPMAPERRGRKRVIPVDVED